MAGGKLVSSTYVDLGVWMDNPGLMDSTVAQTMSVAVNPYFSDINRYVFTSSFKHRKIDHLMVGVNYNSYGNFQRRDVAGNLEGEFTGRSYVIQVGAAHQLSFFTIGASLKYAGLSISNTQASLALMDLGGAFRSPNEQIVIGLSIKNFGIILEEPATLESSRLPFDVVAGVSVKPQYMPFRFTVTAYDLPRFSEIVVPVELQRDGFFAPALRYVNPSVSLMVQQLFEFQLGYNYRINETLRLENRAFGAGWSFGFKLMLDRMQIMMARNTYQAAGGTTFLTLQTHFNTIKNIF